MAKIDVNGSGDKARLKDDKLNRENPWYADLEPLKKKMFMWWFTTIRCVYGSNLL